MTECNNDSPTEHVLSQDDAVSFHDTVTRKFEIFACVVKDRSFLDAIVSVELLRDCYN